jgi:hypothetical protein
MDKQIIIKLNKSFEEAAYEQNGVEYWLARDLQILLEYEEWRNFSKVIEKAKTSCQNAGQNQADHFVDVNKTIGCQKKSVDNSVNFSDIINISHRSLRRRVRGCLPGGLCFL